MPRRRSARLRRQTSEYPYAVIHEDVEPDFVTPVEVAPPPMIVIDDDEEVAATATAPVILIEDDDDVTPAEAPVEA